ncbi:MAG: M48 family metallopeptidase [Sulfurovum sp.]|nr:M48 family metallopeptidase [Sulfurovum sp.]
MKQTFKLLIFTLSTLFLTACMSGKMSPQQESNIGAQQERQILSKARLIKSGSMYTAVRKVGMRIASVTGRQDFKWRYHLVDNAKQANAFVLPGGKVFVYTGLFKFAANEAELAAVIGHEVAHALRSHGIKNATRKQRAGILGALLHVGMGVAGIDKSTAQQINKAYGQGATLGYIRPYSRQNEMAADSIGVMIMAEAGYDPRAALRFWDKFAKQGQHIPEYLSTHPAAKNRIANIKSLLPQAMALYQKSKYRKK